MLREPPFGEHCDPYLRLRSALERGAISADTDMPFSISSATTNTTVCFTKVYIEAGSFFSLLFINRKYKDWSRMSYLLPNTPLKAGWWFILSPGADHFFLFFFCTKMWFHCLTATKHVRYFLSCIITTSNRNFFRGLSGIRSRHVVQESAHSLLWV